MRFLAYRETSYRDWTIQHTWRTSKDRPGPDGFDRVAVRGAQVVAQGQMTWTAFMAHLDTLDGLRKGPAPLPALEPTAKAPRGLEPKKPMRRRGRPDPGLQSLFEDPV